MRAVHLVPAGVVLVALGAIGGVAQLGHPAAAQRPGTPGHVSSPAAIRQVATTPRPATRPIVRRLPRAPAGRRK